MNNFGYILKSNGLKQLINSRFPSVKLVPRKTRHVTLSRFQYEIGWVLGPCVYLQERVMPASQLHVLSILISCQYEDEIHRLSIIQLGKKKVIRLINQIKSTDVFFPGSGRFQIRFELRFM